MDRKERENLFGHLQYEIQRAKESNDNEEIRRVLALLEHHLMDVNPEKRWAINEYINELKGNLLDD